MANVTTNVTAGFAVARLRKFTNQSNLSLNLISAAGSNVKKKMNMNHTATSPFCPKRPISTAATSPNE